MIPCYNGGKFYVKYLITMKDDFDLDYLYRTGETDSNMGSGIIDGNGNTIVDLVKGFITLNKETSFLNIMMIRRIEQLVVENYLI